uniref:Uncharacterized protein n=1 Tax=Anopheles atroparvus TaxID=41427 RepID=A0A182JD15_ANOAO
MLGISKKPGPPVPPRPSAAAVATALAKQRENSPSPTTLAGKSAPGMATLKPPHPGRTVVYKSPDFSHPNKNPSHLSSFGSAKQQPPNSPSSQRDTAPIRHDAASVDDGDKIGQGRSNRSLLTSGVMYRSTCSIVEINTSSSASSSVSTSPVATLQKQPEQKSKPKALESLVTLPVARRRTRPGETPPSGGPNGGAADVIIVNGTNGSSTISLSSGAGSLEEDARTGRRKLPGESVGIDFHDSGTERGDSSGSSASAGSTLERENNLRNLESSSAKSSHFTEIIIGSNQSSTVVRSGSKPNVAARTLEGAGPGPTGGGIASSNSANVIRSSSVRLPIGVPPPYRRPEPEGGEYVLPSSDNQGPVASAGTGPVQGKPQPTTTKATGLDPATLDSKLSEKKFAFHELLISELTAMRQKQQQQEKEADEKEQQEARDPPQEGPLARKSTENSSPALGVVDLAKINRRQRCPSERRSSCSESDASPNGTSARLPKIRTADWIEVGDNGTQVVLSSCQISLEDSGMEDEEKLDDASSGVGDSWDSVKEGVEERIIMSLPGLPPLPKSLSGFDLAGIQFQSHHHHLPHHHHQPHLPPSAQHNPHYPPRHPPPHHQQSVPSHQSHHHQQQQQQSFHGTSGGMSTHPSALPPSSQMSQVTAALNHHHTNPFIPIGPSSMLLHAGAGPGGAGGGGVGTGAGHEGQQQRGHSPVSSTLSGGRKASPQPPQQSTVPGSGQTTTLDTQLAILRREMVSVVIVL